MVFKEHNNREIANKHAEYITGQALRQYLADKVKQYLGEPVTVFDGAVGSGQLEQFIQPSHLYGVEIQAASVEACRENFPNSTISHQSFFTYESEVEADAVVMNPPFSLKFKDLPEEDKLQIQAEFPWKKSGVVDDIFLLKSLRFTKRYAFHIMFPGPAYRKTEKMMRELIGHRLVELNQITNAFEDTGIAVMFLVIDKEKTSPECKRELYDCKAKSQLVADTWVIDSEHWELPRVYEEEEVIDIDVVNTGLDQLALSHLENHLRGQLLAINYFEAKIDFLSFISKAYDILNRYEVYYNFGVLE